MITPFHHHALRRVSVLRKQLRKALQRAYELSLQRPESLHFRAARLRVRYLSVKHQAARKLAILLNRQRAVPVRLVPPPRRATPRPSRPHKNRRFANVVCMPAVAVSTPTPVPE